jgi:hypothetical protein
MNQSEVVSDLLQSGWRSYMPDNSLGWKFFFRRNNEHYHAFFGWGYDYLTVRKSGHVVEGIRETCHQMYVRRKREILFRDFRNYPRVK